MPPPEKPALENPGGIVEFPYDPATFKVTDEMKQVYDYDGAIVVKGLLNKDEISKITKQLEMNDEITGKGWELPDGTGTGSKLVIWSHPGNDVTGMVARCGKVAQTMEDTSDGTGTASRQCVWSHPGSDVTGMVSRSEKLVDTMEEISDGTGSASKLCLWNQPGNDLTGMVPRCHKVADTMEQLMGGEVYHYHTKLMMKDARTGGKHLWHQDYGYWYKNGNLKPDMGTVFIPLDPCRKANGCLQVVKGTQRCGRIEHDLVHGQTVANDERVKWMCENFEHVYAEMDPGDGLFFHCNLLHTSDRNTSDTRRWCFLCSYNRADNNPLIEHHHPQYRKLDKVPNDSIMSCENLTDLTGKDFMDPKSDKTVKADLKGSNFH